MTHPLRRWPAVIAGIALVVIASKVVVEDLLGLTWMGIVREFVTTPSLSAAALIVGLLTVDLLVPVPSSVLMILSGAVFGIVPGGLLALAGSLAGNILGFEAARRYGRDATRRVIGDAQLARMQAVFARHGALAILVSRPLPVLMETLSVAAGLSGMGRAAFLAASLAGTVPVVFVYSWAGSRSIGEGTLVPAIVMLIAVAAGGWLLSWPILRARRSPAASEYADAGR
jgi:uncharacterized membrane protein YdjX (TVP38/TMEM64 family)